MNKQNPMACDLTTGICGDAGDNSGSVFEMIDLNPPVKQVDMYYVTDPICSHCWALEPVFRKFTQQYGKYLRIRTVTGGLLANWDGFADSKNGIGKPADVAGHWQEVGEHSRMPIDGSLWLSDPIMSSYPPSRVFQVIRQQSEELASVFLRRAREAVFAFNRNIGKDEVLIDIVNQMGLDGAAIITAANETSAQQLLEEDFALASSLGARGFPTILFVNEQKQALRIVGAQSLEHYVSALEQILGEKLQAAPTTPLATVLQQEKLLFAKEIEVLYDQSEDRIESYADALLTNVPHQKQQVLGETYYQLTE
ncbi:DsbA family protein [Paenibacillus yanchengensis]|uniref:DsbA family protein n=1 Tax=Paenibacillus yanchengensis TaxID=2035833 RepID=A0ABW4YLN1_9BACL